MDFRRVRLLRLNVLARLPVALVAHRGMLSRRPGSFGHGVRVRLRPRRSKPGPVVFLIGLIDVGQQVHRLLCLLEVLICHLRRLRGLLRMGRQSLCLTVRLCGLMERLLDSLLRLSWAKVHCEARRTYVLPLFHMEVELVLNRLGLLHRLCRAGLLRIRVPAPDESDLPRPRDLPAEQRHESLQPSDPLRRSDRERLGFVRVVDFGLDLHQLLQRSAWGRRLLQLLRPIEHRLRFLHRLRGIFLRPFRLRSFGDSVALDRG
mmetsp:Transcript_119820/g.339135  ORF Transcript_119820/g.339135 Transcript_119820/m.339135 type:complete len:261 (-) Transcript_119820:1388-2170(-)